uniref:Ig-like domain-containing protein n=1 Tax=Otolemur garnettii TaxID=30611 RepID=H0XXI1_OTOGA
SNKFEISIDGDQHTLRVKNCQLKDQGNYRLVCGPHIASAKLTVIAEPIQFTKRIQNIVVSEHQSATFECEVSFDDAIVTWYKGPTELIESQKYNFRNDGRCHYMTIHNVTPDDEGVYSVIARLEPRGEARSTAELYLTTKAEIKLELKPPDIPDSRVPIPTMPIRAVPPEEIPPAVIPPIPLLLPTPEEKKPPVTKKAVKKDAKKVVAKTTEAVPTAPEIIDITSKAEEVKITTITRKKEVHKEKEPVYEKKQAVHEEWEEDFEEGQEYYEREEGYEEGEEEWEETYQEREVMYTASKIRREEIPEVPKKPVPEEKIPVPVAKKKEPPPAKDHFFKVPEVPKKPVPEKKVPVPTPKKEAAPPAKVPEAPKEVVPEKKVTVAPPKKPEVPPAKVPEAPKEVVPEKKVSVAVPKKPEAPPTKVPEAPKEVVPEKKVTVAPPKKPEVPPQREIEKYIEPEKPEPEPEPEPQPEEVPVPEPKKVEKVKKPTVPEPPPKAVEEVEVPPVKKRERKIPEPTKVPEIKPAIPLPGPEAKPKPEPEVKTIKPPPMEPTPTPIAAPVTVPVVGKKAEAKPKEEAAKPKGPIKGVAKKTPSPIEIERKKLRPGSGGEKPPDEAPFSYQLKAVPLKFVKEIQDIVLTESEFVGSSAIFECLVSPSTAITTWMKDGSNIRESPKHRFIADGKDRKLHIIDVQLSDAGEYTCVLRLGNKEKTSTAKLVVEELPVRFVKTLEEEVTVVKGQPLYLSCELNKERDVVWRKDGKIVVEKPGRIVPGVIGLLRALTINDADDTDAGTYTVTVENANNLECSSCVKVVEVIRDWLVKPIRDQHVKPKGTAIFACDIAKDTPNIKWFKGYDELPLEPTDKTEILRDGNHLFLKIKNAMPEDIGEYAVEIEGKRYPAKLTLGDREVELLKPIEDVTIYEKESASFDAEISEADIPGQWKLKGELLRPSPTCEIKAEGGKRFLTLHKVKLDQAGEVLYQALNAITTAILTVKEIELDFAVPLKDVTVPERRQARFEC